MHGQSGLVWLNHVQQQVFVVYIWLRWLDLNDQYTCVFLGGVYMTLGRLSRQGKITPVPSHGFIFVYMIPPQNVMPGWEFHSSRKSGNSIMQTLNNYPLCEIGLPVDWNR